MLFRSKAIASKGKKAPDTILSRAIFIMQKRRTRGETVAHFSHIDDDGLAHLRSQLADGRRTMARSLVTRVR